jgi:hypothetical protein
MIRSPIVGLWRKARDGYIARDGVGAVAGRHPSADAQSAKIGIGVKDVTSKRAFQIAATSVGRGVYWTLLVVLFGLSQLWLTLGYRMYVAPEQVSAYESVKDGTVLFFTLAISVGVTLDYFFDEGGPEIQTLAKSTAFVFVPLVVALFVVSCYFIIIVNPAPARPDVVTLLNACAFSIAVAQAAIGKTYLFYKSKLNRIGALR